MKKLQGILLILLLFQFVEMKANNNSLDSLYTELEKAKADTNKIMIYHELGFYFEYLKPDTARYFFEKALEIAKRKTKTVYNQGAGNKKIKNKVTGDQFQYLLLASKSNRYIGYTYNDIGDFKTAIEYYKTALNIARAINPFSDARNKKPVNTLIADNIVSIGLGYYYTSRYNEALLKFDSAKTIYENIHDSLSIAKCYTCYGMVCRDIGDRDCAIEHFHKSLKIYLKFNSQYDIAGAYGNLAHVYMQQKDLELALDYYDRALEVFTELDIPSVIGKCYNGMGIVYEKQGKLEKAEEYYNKYLKICKELGDKYGMSAAYTNLAVMYKLQENYSKSLDYYSKSYEIDLETGDKHGQGVVLNNMSLVYKFLGQYQKSIDYAIKALEINKEIGRLHGIRSSLEFLSALYDSLGDYKKAYYYHWHFKEVHDSIYSETSDKRIRELEEKYQAEQRQLEIDNLEKDNLIKENTIRLQEYDNKVKNRVLVGLIILLILIALFSFILFRLFIQKKHANKLLSQQKEEIAAQRDEIEAQRDLAAQQRDLISEQKQDITDSIKYAYKIQSAIFPDPMEIRLLLKEYFILYKPRDIVSGDFYWVNKQDNKIIVIAADCTGHGVPGAFMSMLGVAYLNEIVSKERITNPARILDRLRENVILALRQRGDDIEQKDGMDVAAITIDPENQKLEFAGANNPLYLIRNNELEEMKGDKMPVSIHIRMKPFVSTELEINRGDTIYIFSDGYADQFGGAQGKKFKYKNFKELLLKNASKPMMEQEKILNETFESWRGNYDQIDDVLVIGVKV